MRHYFTNGILIIITILLASGCGSSNGNANIEATPSPAADSNLPSSESSSSERVEPPITIVAMGDSLTEGLGVDPELAYPAQLEDRLRQDGHAVSVINAGISGETSSGALSRVEWILSLKPDIVILVTGANDGLRGIDPELTHSNIDKIVSTFASQDVTVVLGGMQIVQNMGTAYVEEFRAIYPAVAEAHSALLIPFFLENVAAVPALNQPDEIHPTSDGYQVVVDTITPYIQEALSR